MEKKVCFLLTTAKGKKFDHRKLKAEKHKFKMAVALRGEIEKFVDVPVAVKVIKCE